MAFVAKNMRGKKYRGKKYARCLETLRRWPNNLTEMSLNKNFILKTKTEEVEEHEWPCFACSEMAYGHSIMFGKLRKTTETSENYTCKNDRAFLISSIHLLSQSKRALFENIRGSGDSSTWHISWWTALSCAFLCCALYQAVSKLPSTELRRFKVPVKISAQKT